MLRSAPATGASLMASGRVPMTTTTGLDSLPPSSAALHCRQLRAGATLAEIIGVGLDLQLDRCGRNQMVGELVALGVGNRLVARSEGELDLRVGVARPADLRCARTRAARCRCWRGRTGWFGGRARISAQLSWLASAKAQGRNQVPINRRGRWRTRRLRSGRSWPCRSGTVPGRRSLAGRSSAPARSCRPARRSIASARSPAPGPRR